MMLSFRSFARIISISLILVFASTSVNGQLMAKNVYRGRLALMSGKLDMALYHLNKEIKVNENNPYAYYYRAKTFAQSGNIDAAVEDIQKTIDLKPDDSRAYSFYGQIFLAAAGDDEETLEIALWAFNNTIKYDSVSENIYSFRAKTKFRLGD